MASLRERNGVYYIVFTKRTDGKLEQKVYSLRTKNKRKAEELKEEYGELYDLGEIDPFGHWDPKKEAELKRKQQRGITLTETIEQFLEERSHVREITRKGYRRILESLAETVGRTMPVQFVTDEDIRGFCFKARHSNATQATYLRNCKMFFRWLKEVGHVEKDVSDRIRYPKRENKVSQKTINEVQLQAIFEVFKKEQREKITAGRKRGLHIWFKPVVATAFYGGLRVSEIIRLEWRSLNIEQGYLRVTRSKNGKERSVPLQKKLIPHLAAWKRLCPGPHQGLVFFKSNSPGTHTGRKVPLTRNNVSKVFKHYATAAKMPDGVTFHGLRHSCATELLRHGMGLHEVASILGHSDLQVTRIYEHLNEQDLKRKMRQLDI